VIPGLKRRPPPAAGSTALAAAPLWAPAAVADAAAPQANKKFKCPLPAGAPGAAPAAPVPSQLGKENLQPEAASSAGEGVATEIGAGTAASDALHPTAAPAAAQPPVAMLRKPGFRPPSLVRPGGGGGGTGLAAARMDALGLGAASTAAGGSKTGAEGPSTVYAVLYTKVRISLANGMHAVGDCMHAAH